MCIMLFCCFFQVEVSLIVRRELRMGRAFGGAVTQVTQSLMDVQDSKVL